MSNISLDLTYSAPQQEIFFNDLRKFNIIPKGKRLGLTLGAAQAFIEYAIDGMPFMLWGDTINSNIDRYYERYFVPVLKKLGSENYKWSKQKHELTILNSKIDFRSADSPENWEGFGYHMIFLNEAGIILKNDYLYDNAVLPMLMDYPESKLIAAGVPKGTKGKEGDHKFYLLAKKAQEDKTGDYKYLHYTSYDNPFLSVEEIAKLERNFDPLTAKQEIYAEFIEASVRPFMYCFTDEHISDGRDINRRETVFLSFDFNVDPITCSAWQHGKDWIACLYEFRLRNSDIYELCEHIKNELGDLHYVVTGDASGMHRSVLTKGNFRAYTIILQELNLRDTQIKVPGQNPPISESKTLCNSILARHPNIRFHPRCKYMIEDFRFVQIDESGQIDKKTNAHRSHLMDSARYYFNTFHSDFIK